VVKKRLVVKTPVARRGGQPERAATPLATKRAGESRAGLTAERRLGDRGTDCRPGHDGFGDCMLVDDIDRVIDQLLEQSRA
jgi:hypothetical protein